MKAGGGFAAFVKTIHNEKTLGIMDNCLYSCIYRHLFLSVYLYFAFSTKRRFDFKLRFTYYENIIIINDKQLDVNKDSYDFRKHRN